MRPGGTSTDMRFSLETVELPRLLRPGAGHGRRRPVLQQFLERRARAAGCGRLAEQREGAWRAQTELNRRSRQAQERASGRSGCRQAPRHHLLRHRLPRLAQRRSRGFRHEIERGASTADVDLCGPGARGFASGAPSSRSCPEEMTYLQVKPEDVAEIVEDRSQARWSNGCSIRPQHAGRTSMSPTSPSTSTRSGTSSATTSDRFQET